MTNTTKQGIKTRQKIYDFIVQYITDHGYSPTVREIAEGAGVKSTNTVQRHLVKMLDSGMLETDAGFNSPRTIRVPGYKFIKV